MSMADESARSIAPNQSVAAASSSISRGNAEPAVTKPKRHLRSWKRRKKDRPVEILAAVKAAIAERGIENVRMADIAIRANVAKGTLYCYFSKKAELLEFVRAESQDHKAITAAPPG